MVTGGELMQYIYKKTHLTETETRKYMRQMVSAVDHLHKAGIIHRYIEKSGCNCGSTVTQ